MLLGAVKYLGILGGIMKKDVVYIGNYYKVAEYIKYSDKLNLKYILCEEDKITDELLTFSLVRNVPIVPISKNYRIDDHINQQNTDSIYIMCSYGKRIPIENCKSADIYNIHFSALPNFKGRHPSYWATLNGELHLGISLHTVNEHFDQGEIISRYLEPYYIWENEEQIFEKLTTKISLLLSDLCDYIDNGNKAVAVQNKSGDYYRPVKKEDTFIDLQKDSPDIIFNKVRSQARAGGAFVQLEDRLFVLHDLMFTQNVGCENVSIKNGCLFIKINDGLGVKSVNFEELSI